MPTTEFRHVTYGICWVCGHSGALTDHACSRFLFDRLKTAARELSQQDEFGALHIFVSDGNCEDDSLEFCLKDERLTASEKAFTQRMLDEFTEEQRFAVWAFAQCVDIK